MALGLASWIGFVAVRCALPNPHWWRPGKVILVLGAGLRGAESPRPRSPCAWMGRDACTSIQMA
ncbi:MAG: hypothetical protein IPN40_06295 [Uliginosibacterium sp.]|nr:hypothetical protein [Uliginosibacterium sp.]